jgi:hypothetical protein
MFSVVYKLLNPEHMILLRVTGVSEDQSAAAATDI